MGLVRVVLPVDDYTDLDEAMSARGFMRHIPRRDERVEQLYALPRGSYWMAEPTRAEDLLDAAIEAVTSVHVMGARILVTEGETRWAGLEMIGESERVLDS
jgi:hypothetical protein